MSQFLPDGIYYIRFGSEPNFSYWQDNGNDTVKLVTNIFSPNLLWIFEYIQDHYGMYQS